MRFPAMHFLDKYLWGKSTPYKHLSRHMVDAGACAVVYLSSASMIGMTSKLANLMGISAGDAIAFLSYLASLHDLGKAFPHFVRSSEEQYARVPEEIKRKYFPRSEGVKFRHERESERAAVEIWTATGDLKRDARETFAAVLGLHHQGKRGDIPRDEDGAAWQEAWRAAQGQLEERMRALFCPRLPQVRITHHDALGAYLVGLIVLCDWVASSGAFDDMPEVADDGAYRDMAIERAGNALRARGLIGDAPFPRVDRFSALWPAIAPSDMRPVQAACAEAANRPALLTIIEARCAGRMKDQADAGALMAFYHATGGAGAGIHPEEYPFAALSISMLWRESDHPRIRPMEEILRDMIQANTPEENAGLLSRVRSALDTAWGKGRVPAREDHEPRAHHPLGASGVDAGRFPIGEGHAGLERGKAPGAAPVDQGDLYRRAG